MGFMNQLISGGGQHPLDFFRNMFHDNPMKSPFLGQISISIGFSYGFPHFFLCSGPISTTVSADLQGFFGLNLQPPLAQAQGGQGGWRGAERQVGTVRLQREAAQGRDPQAACGQRTRPRRWWRYGEIRWRLGA